MFQLAREHQDFQEYHQTIHTDNLFPAHQDQNSASVLDLLKNLHLVVQL